MHAQTNISVFDTDPDLYDTFAQAFKEQTNPEETHAWINFKTTGGVEVTLFKLKQDAVALGEAV